MSAKRKKQLPVIGESWTIDFKTPLPTRLSFLIGFLGFICFLLAWHFGSIVSKNTTLFPSPIQVVLSLFSLFWEDKFLVDILASLKRVTISFWIAAVFAIPLGVLMGSFAPIKSFFGPIVSAGRYLPATAFVPIFLMWFGTGEKQKIALLTAGVIFFLITLIIDNTMAVPSEYIESAKTLGANRKDVLWTVILPASLPVYMDTLRQMLAVSWTYLVVAEIVAATDGIGAMMMRAKRFVKIDDIMAGIFVIGTIGLLVDLSLRLLRKYLFPYSDAS